MCGLDFFEDFPIHSCHIRWKETIDWRWPSDSWMDFDSLCSRPSPYRAIRAWVQCTTSSAHSSILSEDWQVLTQPIGPIGNHHITSPIAASCNQLNQLTTPGSQLIQKNLVDRGGGNAWGQKFITWPPKPNTYHRYKPFCLKDHILLVKKKSFPSNITFWTEMAISTLI